MPLLMSSSKSILGYDISISFVNLEETETLKKDIIQTDPQNKTSTIVSQVSVEDTGPSFLQQLSLNKRFTFNSFVAIFLLTLLFYMLLILFMILR